MNTAAVKANNNPPDRTGKRIINTVESLSSLSSDEKSTDRKNLVEKKATLNGNLCSYKVKSWLVSRFNFMGKVV